MWGIDLTQTTARAPGLPAAIRHAIEGTARTSGEWVGRLRSLCCETLESNVSPSSTPKIIILFYLRSDSSVVLCHAVITSTLNLTSTCRCQYCGHSLVIDFGGATFDDSRKSKIINTRQYRGPEVREF